MSSAVLLIVYCLAIIAASILGGLIPLVIRLTHTRLQVAISLTAGFMLGVALLHMIPHAIDTHAPGSGHGGVTPMTAMMGVLVGFMFMFFIERFFSFHTHEVAELDDAGKVLTSAEDLPGHHHEDHAHHQDHAHAHGMVGHTPGNKLSWTGAAIGMTLHSLIAGVALASAVASETAPGNLEDTQATAANFAGLAVFLVIVSHKPLDALTVITLTASAGFRKSTRHLINGLFALAVPLGVVLFAFGLSQTTLAESGTLVGLALAFSAGTFLCIALSDLLPELHFHAHDRTKLTAALVLGVVLAYVMATLEHSMHDHDHGGHGQHDDHAGHDHGEGADDDHDGHDHGSHEGHDHGAPPSNTSDGWSDFLKRD
ncbi:MAG: ZIP family metal transporter [Planctomycetota bacterium]